MECTSRPGVYSSGGSNKWPLDDCHHQNIDLVFVLEPSSFQKPFNQIGLFTLLVDVFSPERETTLDRLRVSLVIPSNSSSTNTVVVDTKIALGYHKTKQDLKSALREVQFPNIPKPSIAESVRAVIQSVFNHTDYETRPDTIKAIIMVIHALDSKESIKYELLTACLTAKRNRVRLFYVIVRRESGTDADALGLMSNNYVIVENLDNMAQMIYIPLRLCNVCFSGWFKIVNETSRNLANISCYRIALSAKSLNWIDANEICKRNVSELASIETVAEHNLLKAAIPRQMNYSQLRLNSTNGVVSVYIGLRRRLSVMGQRFRWVNQRPLVYTQWRPTQPLGGNTNSCATWDFPFGEIAAAAFSRESENETFELPPGNLVNGWSSVGCGDAAFSFFLCEMTSPASVNKIKLNAIFDEPKRESVSAAIKRGELGVNIGETESLLSAAVLVRNRDLYPISYAYYNHDMDRTLELVDVKMFYCDNFTKIPYSMVCDHVANCTNEADEVRCGYTYRKCDDNMFTCNNKQCVPNIARCDLFKDCLDGSDEEDCITCSHGRCQNARCMPKHWFLDGEIDCSSCLSESLADEATFAQHSKKEECVFICNRTACVDISMLNDSIVHCQGPEGKLDETIGALEPTVCYSDSDNVTTPYTNWAPRCVYIKDRYGEPLGCRNMKHLSKCEDFVCPEGFFKCPDSYCIPIHYLQNSEYECANGEDEGDLTLRGPSYFRCVQTNIYLHPDNVCDGKVDCLRGDDEASCHISCGEGFLCLAGTVTVHDYNKDVPLTNLDFVAPSTRYLDLSGINISAVFPSFPNGRLVNAINISFSGCSIRSLDPPRDISWVDLRGVWWIDLSYNLITRLSDFNILKTMYPLKFLNLSHNENLAVIDNDPFTPFRFFSSTPSHLRVLDLSHTSVSSLKSSLLYLNNLDKLILKNTRIIDIPSNMFPRDFTLKVLDLSGLTVNKLYPEMFMNVTITMFLFTDSFKLCCPQLHNKDTDTKVCMSVSDPFSSCSDLMSKPILRILLWVSGVLAIVGNLCVLIYRLFFDKMIFRMAYGHYIMHLSFADLLMGVYLIVIATADTTYRDSYVWNEFNWRRSVTCKVAGFLSMLSSETSSFFIFLITLDRFFALRLPFRQLKSSRKLITLACTIVWTLGFLVAYIPLLPYFEDWNLYSTNAMCLALPLTSMRLPGWQFSTSICIFLNFFLFLLIAFGQLAIYRSVFAIRISQSKLSNASCRRAQDLAIAKNLSLVVATNFMCWFPIGAMGILALLGYETGPETYAWMAVLVLPINSAINPFLYTVPAVVRKLRQHKEGVTSHASKSH